MDYGWFYHELHERTKWCEFPPLVTTATDGDNGGWFRNLSEKANFWTYFYQQAMDEIRAGHSTMRLTFITDYLEPVWRSRSGHSTAWSLNTDDHHGWDFHQWQGSWVQRDTMVCVHDLSREFHAVAKIAAETHDPNPELARVLHEAHWRLLRAETSVLYWGEASVHKTHADLDSVAWHLGEAKAILGNRWMSIAAAPERVVEEAVPLQEAPVPEVALADPAVVETPPVESTPLLPMGLLHHK